MENLDLGINLGFGSASGVDDLIEKIEVLQKNISNINEVSNIGMFTSALKDFQNLKKEIKEIKELVNATQDVKSNGGDTKNPYKNETFSVAQTLKNIEKSLNEITNINKTREPKNKTESKIPSNSTQTQPNEKVVKINTELKEYYTSRGKNYKNNDKVNTNAIMPMDEKQFRSGFSKIVTNISKEVIDTLDKSIRDKMMKQGSVDMLKGKTYPSEDKLVEEYRKISQLVKNAGYSGNILKNNPQFKKEYNEILNSINGRGNPLTNMENRLKRLGVNVGTSNTDNMTVKQMESLVQEHRNTLRLINSERFKNFNKSVNYKTTEDKLNDYKKTVNEKVVKINTELKEYYTSRGKNYKNNDKVNTNAIMPMDEKQFRSGFSKIVTNISKEVIDTLDKSIRDKMMKQGSVDMLKGKTYPSEDKLVEEYRKISQLVKNAGYSGNILKNNPQFKKEYNEILNSINGRGNPLTNMENRLKRLGVNVGTSNTDNMTVKQMESLVQEHRNTLRLINSERFKNFNKSVNYKTTEDKLNDYKKTVAENSFKATDIKNKGLSLPNTIQQNAGLVFAGVEAFKYLGAITNFITSKDFEKNMGALGIVGGLGNQASQNYSKSRIMRESNIIGADINEFAEGVREVIKTGKSYEQSMNLVSVAGKVAIASFEDLTTATNILNSRFTALNLNANDKNLNEFANRLQSALDNTALDLQDVSNAGKQTNTAMNAIINSAEERGLQNKSVEQYTMDVSNLELALLSTLKQQGKSGEQSGVVLRTLFTKLMSVDGVGKKMLDNDLKKMTKEEKERVGFSSVEEMTSLVLDGEIEKVIEGLSIMQEQGNLAYSTIKKIFTERHSSAISTLFNEVGGDVKGFVDNITTGINVFNNFSKAMENWSVKVDRIFKNIKTISTNTFTKGLYGGILGTTVGGLDLLTDIAVKGQTSNNILWSSLSNAIPQTMVQGFAFKNVNDFTKGKSFQNIENAYDLTKNRINADTTLDSNVKSFRLSKLEEMKNNDLETLINGKGVKNFSNQVKNATTDVYSLSSSIKNAVETGDKGFSTMTTTVKGFGKGLASALQPMAILMVINMSINALISLYEKAEKIKNDALNLDKEIINLSKMGKDIETLENNINTIFDIKPIEESNTYLANVNKYIQANENLKASIDNVNAIKNNPFKNIEEIREDLWKEKTDVSGKINDIRESNRVNIDLVNRGLVRGILDKVLGVESDNVYSYKTEGTTLVNNGYLNDKLEKDYRYKFRGEQFKNVLTYDENEFKKRQYSGTEEKYQLEIARNREKVAKEEKKVNAMLNDVYLNAKQQFKNSVLGNDKNVSKEDREKFIVNNMKFSDELVKNVFGNDISSKLGNKGVNNTNDFYKLLQSMEGKDLEEKAINYMNTISNSNMSNEIKGYYKIQLEYQMQVIKESNELFYKQLERNKESFEQSKLLVESYKSQLSTMYSKSGLPTVAHGNILNEEKSVDGTLLTFKQEVLDKYNKEYNDEINSIPQEMFMNNMEGVQNYQASMSVYYQKKATLDKEIMDTQQELEEAKKSGSQQEIDNFNKKLEWLKNDLDTLNKSKELAKKVLHFSNFSAKTYQELLTMGTELAKNYAQYQGLVGTSFGNRGSQLQTQLASLNASRGLYDKIGKMNFNNQVSSAYIQDPSGTKLSTINGKTDYSQVNMNDYNKIQSEIEDYRKNGINTRNGISIEDLQEQATMVSSLIAEQYNMKQQELGFMQQEKQLQIDITKYYIERNKLIANFTESAETKQSDIDIKSANINYSMRYGGGKYNSIEELQRVTNLKLENSNLKMKDQLDYAKRQIMVAKENSTRQINAIRRLESKNTSNSQKSDTQSKQNSNETNRTIVESSNTISNNLNNALNQIMTTIQTMQTSYNPTDSGTVVSNDIIEASLELTSKRETGKGLSVEASRSVAKDTGNSLSFGIFGINNKTGSYKTFYDMFKSKFPELSANANPDNWRIVADKYGQEFIKAQVEWKKQLFSKNVFGGSIENFVKQYTGLVNDTDIKRAGIYLVDASTQYGSGGLISAVKTNKFKGISNINDLLNAFNNNEKDNIGGYFKRALGDGSASRKGLYGAFDMRLNYSKNAQFKNSSGITSYFSGGIKSTQDGMKGGKEYSNSGSGQLQIQNVNLPKEYIPKIDKITQNEIEKITNYELYKDQIKTEKDEQKLIEVANLLKGLEGQTYNVGIAELIKKKNSIKAIQTGDETYDVTLNVIEQAIANFENKLELGLENFGKFHQQFIETLSELQYSFRELQNVVNSTNIQYTNAFNFLESVSFTDTFNEFMFKIEETQVKLEQYNRKLELETNYDNNVRQNLFGLLDKQNISIEGNPLETSEDMRKFLTNRGQMLDVMEVIENLIEQSFSKNFDNLEYDKASLRNASAEEIDKIKYEMATKLSEKGYGQDIIFKGMNELNNNFETLKLLKTQIEKINEVRKTEIELIKQNTKYLSEYSKNISNMLKEVGMVDNSKARSIRTLLAENSLVNKGISLESNYAKNYISSVNARNKYEEYQEEMYNFNRSLKYDSSLRSILKSGGYSDNYLNNYDLNNMNYNDISSMANVILDYQDKARYTVQQELNDLVNKFSLNDRFKDIDLTDMEVIRGLNAETLANETGNSVENMKEFLNGVNIVKNSVHNTDNILETLTKVLNANKTAHEESTRMYQELYKQGLNLLSDMLFGDGDFKGLSSEQYTQALDSLLQFGINSFGSVSNSFKGLFSKDKDTTKGNTKVALDNNKATSGSALNTNNLLETINENNVKLIDTVKNQDLMVSADNGLLILPEELKRSINKNLETKSLFSFETPNNFDFGKKVEESIVKEPQLFNAVSQSLLSHYISNDNPFKRDTTHYSISDTSDTLPLEIFDNKELRDKILNNGNDVNSQLALDNNKQKKKSTYNEITNLTLNSIIVLDGFMKKQMQHKKQELELQGKILEMNLQMAETSEERRRIEEQILQNKLAQVDNEYNISSSFMGGEISGSAGFGIQGALSGAMTGMSLGGGVGAIVGTGLGLVGGLFGGSNAKIQAEQQKAQLIAQQKLTWLAEDRNKYLKNMASAMSEQAKWTTKIGVNDAISRSVRASISSVDTIGGTASDTRTVQNKKKKGGGLLGSKKYDTVQSFTASYNTNDSMFGGRVFDDRTDLEYSSGVLAKRILGNKLLTQVGGVSNASANTSVSSGLNVVPSKVRKNANNTNANQSVSYQYQGSLAEYLDKKIASSSIELNADQFIKAFNGQATLSSMGMLVDTSRDGEISALISNMKDQYSKMGASQSKVDMLALINFYENIQALLDKEGKTTKRLFGNYYGIETEEVKDEKGNITEYRRVNESMWSDLYQQQFQNIMNGTNTYDIGGKFIQGTVNAFIQNVSSSRDSVKAITDEFNRLADEIYNVVTRTGEFSNVSGSIKGLIDNMAILKEQQRETENFTIDLAKRWVSLGGDITDVVTDMNNGLSLTIDNIKSNMLGDSLENTINNFGNSLFQELGESMTTNLVNQKYADSVFKMNSLLTNATDTNSISDIVALANGYKGMSVQIESDRERLSAIQRLFTANRDIDYVDESIQYETGTSQSITNNYTFTTDINAGTIVADELSKEILAQNLFGYMVQMFKDSGLIK